MLNKFKKIKLVGEFIKSKRVHKSLSQKELGHLLTPPVTTQFISNVERGITPLPLGHVPALAKALEVSQTEILSLLEKDYVLKLSSKLKTLGGASALGVEEDLRCLYVASKDYPILKHCYEMLRFSDKEVYQKFISACEEIFKTSFDLENFEDKAG